MKAKSVERKTKSLDYKILSFLFILNAAMFLFVGCQKEDSTAKRDKGPAVIPVKVIKVERRDLKRNLEYVGNIKAKDEVTVYPKVSGKVIEKLKKDGEKINKNEVLLYIDRDETGLSYNKAPVESPITGVLGRTNVDIGSSVNTQTPVALVVDMQTVKIELDIPEVYLPKVYLGQEAVVTVDAYPKEEFKGKVTQVSPVVNLDNRSAPIEITLENKDYFLKSGMFARVILTIEEHPQSLVILKEAINGKEADTYVYVIEDQKAVYKKIALGIRQGTEYEVTEGLKEGDLVVIVGQQRLYENAQVMVEQNGK